MDTYPYTDAWKSSVDRNGEEWRAYCEAVDLLRSYFRKQIQHGREAAKQYFEDWLKVLAGTEGDAYGKEKKKGTRGPQDAERLKMLFLTIGIHEGIRIRREVQQKLNAEQSNSESTKEEIVV